MKFRRTKKYREQIGLSSDEAMALGRAETVPAALAAVDEVLFKHAEDERLGIDEMFLRMLQQVGPEKHGLLVETEFKPTPFDVAHGNNVTSAMIATTITLSPEVPFGEVRYRDKKED